MRRSLKSRPPAGVPVYRPDIYATEAIIDPHPHYARLRELGPVVWLPKQRVYALPRFGECKAVLRDDKTFVSGGAVALNPISNRLSRGTTLGSDGSEHSRRRKLVAHRMLPRALGAISDSVTEQAARVVDAAVAKGEIDGVTDLATALPLAVVPDLVGWPRDQRDAPARLGRCDIRCPRPAESAMAQSVAVEPADAAFRAPRRAPAQRASRAAWAMTC